MIKYIIVILLVVNPLYAFSLDEALEKLGSTENVKNISVDNLTDDLKSQANKKIEEIENKINKKIDSYDKKITSEINKAVSVVDKNIAELDAIKNRAYTLIKWVKIFIAVITSSVVIILFLVYRAFARIKKLTTVMHNIASYKDIESRLSKVEKILSKTNSPST